ncbi:hypothetical protein [Haloferax prahovense]|uniref:hypothetical protein n=1 Tax=Haloferax prahovense TaxID=381852 RepID=UPI0012DD8933|nr:hypothetical protein [Haloferax prahovense]
MIDDVRKSHISDFNNWNTIRQSAVSLIRTNLLVFAAFIPGVSIFTSNDLADLAGIYQNPLVILGVGASLVAIGSAGFTNLLVQTTFRNHFLGDEDIKEEKQIEQYRELTDYLAVSEVFTAISVPLVFFGLVRQAFSIPYDTVFLALMLTVGGSVVVRLIASTTVSLFTYVGGVVNQYRELISDAFDPSEPDTWNTLNVFIALFFIFTALLVVYQTFPLITIPNLEGVASTAVLIVNLILGFLLGSLFWTFELFGWVLFLMMLKRFGVVDIPEEVLSNEE